MTVLSSITEKVGGFYNFLKERSVEWGGIGELVSSIFLSDASSINKKTLMKNNRNWVYVCTDRIAEAMSSINIRLYKETNKGTEEVTEHPVLTLLAKPHPQITGRDFIYITTAHKELAGNAYMRIDKEQNPTRLTLFDPSLLRVQIDRSTGEFLGYVSTDKRRTFPIKEILHDKYPNPNNIYEGKGTLEGISEWVDVDSYATKFNRLFFLHGAKLGGTIETESTDAETIEMIKMGFSDNHQGVDNAHKVGVLPKGAKFKESSKSPKDMEFEKADNRFRDKILAGFGVPKSIVGLVEDVNRANAEASNFVFMKYTIKPKADRLMEFLNEMLLPLFSNTEGMYFAYDEIVPENRELINEERKIALGNQPYKSINEVREEEGLAPVKGGDVVMGDLNKMPVGEVDTSKSVHTPKERKMTSHERQRREHEKGVDSLVSDVMKHLTEASTKIKEDKLASLHKEFVTRVSDFEKRYAELIKEYNKNQQLRVMKNIRKIFKKSVKTKIAPDEIMDRGVEVKAMIDLSFPLMHDLIEVEGEANGLIVGFDDFDATDKAVTEGLEKAMKKLAESYNDETVNLISKQIEEAVELGEGIAKITERIQNVYEFSDITRAMRVARTETFRIANFSATEAYKQSGVVETVRWYTAEDERVCQWCNPMNATIIKLNENFFNLGDTFTGEDGGKLNVDYDDIAYPPLHPNCRCWTAPEDINV